MWRIWVTELRIYMVKWSYISEDNVEGFVGECGSNSMSEEGSEEYCGKQ